jgi:hypothetical protein
MWAGGEFLQPRMEDHSECTLVLIGATPEGKMELVGSQVGIRDSAQSGRELLVDVKRRGLKITPERCVAGLCPYTNSPLTAQETTCSESPKNNIIGDIFTQPASKGEVPDPIGHVCFDADSGTDPQTKCRRRAENSAKTSHFAHGLDSSPQVFGGCVLKKRLPLGVAADTAARPRVRRKQIE